MLQNLTPHMKRQSAGVTAFENYLRSELANALENSGIEDRKPWKDRTQGRYNDLYSILRSEEQLLYASARRLLKQEPCKPFRRQVLPNGPMVETHASVDRLVEQGAGEQGNAFHGGPICENRFNP